MSSLSDTFFKTVEVGETLERIAHNLGMGSTEALQSAGLIARNNAADNSAIETNRKKRDKEAIERTLQLLTNELKAIEIEMGQLEHKIATSREVIDRNTADIDFIRSLDTESLYGADGALRDDVKSFLKRHGYDDLDDASEDDLRHMLTAIEVRAIEQNDIEQDKIDRWTDRHDHLRKGAQDAVRDSGSDHHKDWASRLSERDPEQLARDRMTAIANDENEMAQSANSLEVSERAANISQEFGM